ncbi:MAG TPA: SpoIID/LytB domain-containing protein [Bdellovibrionales bacterium]|nr:SpoIID/LytB domain-containing protein [Bdellovibrionales bacterium]
MKQYIALLVVSLFTVIAHSTPVYPRLQKGKDVPPPAPGTLLRMLQDHSEKNVAPMEAPDRSFRSLWIRMFPLLSVPLGDPYPETQDLYHLSMAAPAPINIYALDDGQLLATATQIELDFAAGTVGVNGGVFNLEMLWILPSGNDPVLVTWDKGRTRDGKSTEVRVKLRGGFVIRPSTHSRRDGTPPEQLWSMINVVTVNSYLRSVVPSEVIASWHSETLKAQAIAARTYGMYEVAQARSDGMDYDMDPTTWYQSYQGVEFYLRESRVWRSVELPATTSAVSATGSQVITYQGEVIKAFFSSNSGGRTCTYIECLEGSRNPGYLLEKNDAAGVRNSPGGSWGSRANITPATVTERLRVVGITPRSPVRKLEHLERGPSNRTWRLRVRLADGSVINLDRQQTRKMMSTFGPIRSFHYELGTVGTNGKQRIVGRGYGHGVGMSQWGAQLFARQGWNAQRILKYFYSGVEIADLGAGS